MAQNYNFQEEVIGEVELPSGRKARLVKYWGKNQYGDYGGLRLDVGFYHNGEQTWMVSPEHSIKIPDGDKDAIFDLFTKGL